MLLNKLDKIWTKKAAKRKYLPLKLVNECVDYYEKHDVFLNQDEDYFQKKKIFLSNEKIMHKDFQKFIDDTRKSHFTSFTYFYRSIFSKWLERSLIKEFDAKEEYFVVTEKTIYAKLDLYKRGIADKFSQILSQNKDKSNLTIDLRDNFGGYVSECMNICNLLLPKCKMLTQVFKDRVVSYKSDRNMYAFEKIMVLVNENTASSAEILAYALKKNLLMCELIGPKTVGKYVGQDFFVNEKYNYIFSVVSFYWKV